MYNVWDVSIDHLVHLDVPYCCGCYCWCFSAYASYVFSFASCGKVTVKIDGKYFRTYLAIGQNGWATK